MLLISLQILAFLILLLFFLIGEFFELDTSICSFGCCSGSGSGGIFATFIFVISLGIGFSILFLVRFRVGLGIGRLGFLLGFWL